MADKNLSLEQFNKKLKELNNISPEKADKVTFIASNNLYNELVLNSPVDTGNLRSNWRNNKISNAKFQISNNTEYILDVEYDTNSPNRGFVENTIKDNEKMFLALVKKAFEEI